MSDTSNTITEEQLRRFRDLWQQLGRVPTFEEIWRERTREQMSNRVPIHEKLQEEIEAFGVFPESMEIAKETFNELTRGINTAAPLGYNFTVFDGIRVIVNEYMPKDEVIFFANLHEPRIFKLNLESAEPAIPPPSRFARKRKINVEGEI